MFQNSTLLEWHTVRKGDDNDFTIKIAPPSMPSVPKLYLHW